MIDVSKKEMLSTLNGVCLQLRQDFIERYPGNYYELNNEFYSGDTNINEAISILDRYKTNLNSEVTIFYGNKRALTTITDQNGNRIIHTVQNDKKVLDTVFQGKSFTDGGVLINDENYYVSYIPLFDNGKVFGMVFAGLSNQNFLDSIKILKYRFILITFIIVLVLSIIVSIINERFATTITSIKNYLNLLVKKQNATITMDKYVLDRKDELGDLGRYAQEAGNQLNKMISLDPLTEIYNRRAGSQYIDEYFNKAVTENTPFTIVMCDIDFFKKVNDTYGHKTGDEVLCKVAELLNSTESVFTIRWGGEEFLLGFELPKTTVILILQEILEKISKTDFKYKNKTFNITVTFGVSSYTDQTDASSLVLQADKNLYAGKNSGRNTIVF